MTGQVVAFGELLLRLTPPGARLLVQAESLDLVVGGAEANVAAGLASLEHPVRFTGLVSDNALGDRALASLRAAGVDTRDVARATGRMGLYFMEEGTGSRPSGIIYDRAGSAFAEAAPEAIDFVRALAGARLFHAGGITPALGEKGLALAQAANKAARDAGVPISFDANYRSQLWRGWKSDPCAALSGLIADATVLFGNHRDISLLLGHPFAGDTPEQRRAAAEAAFAACPKLEMIASTTREIVNADHHRIAARVDLRTEAYETDTIEVTGIIGRIGSGDAFAAGVLHQWLLGGNCRARADTGLAVIALKHAIPGDMCLVTRAMLASFEAGAGDVRR